MRIVAVGLRGFPHIQGGIEKHCEHLYPRLVNFGCDITVLSRSPYTGNKPYTYKGVKIVPCWTPRQQSLETAFHTLFCTVVAHKYKPDILHYHAVGPGIFVPLAKKLGHKVIATHHGFDYDRAKWGALAKLFLKQGEHSMCSADGIIAVSDHIRDHLQSRCRCPVVTIPNGVDLPEILPAGDFCRKWGVTSGKYFFFLGRLVPEKCVHELFDAFEGMHTDWKLMIAGDADHESPYSRGLKQRAAKNNKIIMTGFLYGKELQEIFSNAGCFVLPSSLEGLPIALLEALSFGLPCIVSDIPANRAVNHPSVHYFPIHDSAALYNQLMLLIENRSPFDRDAGRTFVSKYFNWDAIANKTFTMIQQLFGQ